ncbi:MAG: HD domain-containing protein [Methanobrevibacter sp.]|uniref:HD domain-containing protein n=1 Tax=Methanobrevibacter sp. TaxID=66852 RepID=UPI0026DF7324|nr:HD domain-containing protein [Methanobrevibacter sp.]MDO5848219.1 HD domain-containing protein [Methanobrevibacter sp.]
MKQYTIAKLLNEAIKYNYGDKRRIAHLIKVHDYARTIGILEKIDPQDLFVLESAAILHDIGIKVCEEKYESCGGKLQEREGPKVALEILKKLDYDVSDIDRILFLIAHHHTYNEIDGIYYQILIEADFLVNLEEENSQIKTIENVYKKIFKTSSGKEICKNLFDLKMRG